MARPTKEQISKREKIKSLNLFVRDSDLYTLFEDETSKADITPTELSYFFCNECSKRDLEDIFYESGGTAKQEKILNDKLFKELFKINEDLHWYLFTLYLWNFIYIPPKKYRSDTFVIKQDIEEALGKKLYKYFAKRHYNFDKKHGYPLRDIEHYELFHNSNNVLLSLSHIDLNKEPFTQHDRDKVKSFYEKQTDYFDLRHFTLITRDFDLIEKDGGESNTFVGLDLTKPLEELIEFVTSIKKDYDEDPNNINNFHKSIGLKVDSFECDLKRCGIYKHKNPKPLNGRLMDILFIHDCTYAGIDDAYIMDEIDRYWNKVKNIHREKITKTTLQQYRKFATDYIDEKHYKHFIRGHKLSQN